MSQVKVLIVDDHAMVRAGLRALLSAQPDMVVVGEAEDGVVAVERCRQLMPDVVVMDLTMPGRGGISATEEICHQWPQMKVLVLTMHDDEAYVRQAALAGASGFVLKKAVAGELVSVIRAVHRGEKCFPLSVERAASRSRGLSVAILSEREREVVALIALGHTNAEIARKLYISEKTVETHRAHILAKLNLRTRADIVRFALEHGLMKG